MNRSEIVVPRASWRDVFANEREKAPIPGTRRLLGSQMGPAAMHLIAPSLLSKEWGEVQGTQSPPSLSTFGKIFKWQDDMPLGKIIAGAMREVEKFTLEVVHWLGAGQFYDAFFAKLAEALK